MMNLILKQLEAHGRKRTILDRDGDDEYLDRYYLLHKSDGSKKVIHNFNVFIHQFNKSDDADLFHSHPWPFWRMILTEGYWEHTPEKGRTWYGPGHMAYRPATALHWVELKPGTRPITLFMHFKKADEPWGFLHDGQIIKHDIYLEKFRGKTV